MNIQKLRALTKREFALAIKGFNKKEMIEIIKNYGVFISLSKKASEVLGVLLDIVDGIIEPTETDKKKLSIVRNVVKLTNEDREVVKQAKEFINREGIIYMVNSKGNSENGDIIASELNCEFKKLAKLLHPDVCSKGIKKYKSHLFEQISAQKENFLKLTFKSSDEKKREEDRREIRERILKSKGLL